MLSNKFIKIIVNGKHIKHLKSLGYDNIKCYKELEILTEHLPENSNIKVDVICDNCGLERSTKYQDYNKYTSNRTKKYYCSNCNSIKIKETMFDRYGDLYSKTQECKEKISSTILSKYGFSHYSKTDEYKDKFKLTCLNKYGVDNPFKSSEFKIQENKRKVMEDKMLWITVEELSDWKLYRNKVRNITRLSVKKLEWNGTDYYDNEYIKENFSLHHLDSNYPTIDHKTSIFDGFVNNLPIEVIASVDNLCWTKRIINITKNKKSHN
jgi:hypothetical protein